MPHVAAYDRGYEHGSKQVRQLYPAGREQSYGATQSRDHCRWSSSHSLRELIDTIRSHRDRRHGDNPGMAYLWTCELIHIHHNDYNKIALLKCATHWDI